MKRFIVISAILVILVAGLAVSSFTRAFAADPGTQGQPSQSCQDFFGPGTPLVPNGFNTGGFATADVHYAGNAPQNSTNPNSVAQYDVACFQSTQH
jgi:hypothetical protein